MRKLVLLVVILTMVMASIGCQQAGLTEEEVRNIVREEVAKQLATGQLKDIVGQEMTKQLGAIDELTLSQLNIVNKEDEVVDSFYTMLNGAGAMNLRNCDGRTVAVLFSDSNGNLVFELCNAYEEYVIRMAAFIGDGHVSIFDKYGNVTFSAP